MFSEKIRATGQVSFVLTDENGNVKQQDDRDGLDNVKQTQFVRIENWPMIEVIVKRE